MKIASFLDELRSRDIRVWVEQERLRCSAPAGVLTDDVRDQIKLRKVEIMDFLAAAHSLARSVTYVDGALVPLQPQGNRTPIFGVPGHNGDVFCYRALASHLGPLQPFFGLQPPGLDGVTQPMKRVEDLAKYFVERVRAHVGEGACIVVGFCAGGSVALEVARELLAQGTRVEFLGLFGCPYPVTYRFLPQLSQRLRHFGWRLVRNGRVLLSPHTAAGHFLRGLQRRRQERDAASRTLEDPVLKLRQIVGAATVDAVKIYNVPAYPGRLKLFLPSESWRESHEQALRWESATGEREIFIGPPQADGDNMLREPQVSSFAEQLRTACREVSERQP